MYAGFVQVLCGGGEEKEDRGERKRKKEGKCRNIWVMCAVGGSEEGEKRRERRGRKMKCSGVGRVECSR